MYITQKILDKIEQKYGQPQAYHTTCVMNKIEFDLLKWSMRTGRSHDVTPFVFHNSNLLFSYLGLPSSTKKVTVISAVFGG